MGGELGERPKQGLVTQTVSKIVMSFAQKVRQHHLSSNPFIPYPDLSKGLGEEGDDMDTHVQNILACFYHPPCVTGVCMNCLFESNAAAKWV